MSGTQTREIQTLKPVISVNTVRFGEIEDYLKERNGVKVSNERILGLVSTLEGYEEMRGKKTWIFYNLEKKKLQFTKDMEINDNNELIKTEGKNEKEIEGKWENLPRNKRVHVLDSAIEKAAEGGALVLGIRPISYDDGWFVLHAVDGPAFDARLVYDKQPQAGVLELGEGDVLEVTCGGRTTLIAFDRGAVVTAKRK